MRLAAFIRANIESISVEWERLPTHGMLVPGTENPAGLSPDGAFLTGYAACSTSAVSFSFRSVQVIRPDNRHPLLVPLAQAQEAVTRLETSAEGASPAVAEGLRARMAYREAAGWLSYAHVLIHPHDLALRDRGLTGSYGAAFLSGRLEAQIPATAAREFGFESAPSDIVAGQALRMAQLWRRLAELRTWRPVADADAVHETLQSLGCRPARAAAEIEDWLVTVDRAPGPLLIRAGCAARDWMNRPGVDPRGNDGLFLAASLWCRQGAGRPIALPFWSAPEPRHDRLALRVGLPWMAGFLDCVAAAAKVGLDELARLRQAEDKSHLLGRTARSRLPAAVAAVLRAPIVTARDLAQELDVTPQAALGLLRQLAEAGIVREATGRASWRAFVLA